MPRKPVLFLSLLNLVIRPRAGQISAPSNQHSVGAHHVLPTDREAWRVHWQAQGQPWRTEPEIDIRRQECLAQRCIILPDIEQGIYPFKDIKLSRADVEWLLATHENGCGSVNWRDESQRQCTGLDLRGADMSQQDLSNLPLMHMQGGLSGNDWLCSTPEQDRMAAVRMEETILIQTNLEGAKLNNAYLQGANFFRVSLQEAELSHADLERAFLNEAHLERTNFKGANLKRTNMRGADLAQANLSKVKLEGADLEKVILSKEGQVGPYLVDIHWGDVNLAVVRWPPMKMLGDENEARHKQRDGKIKDRATRLEEYRQAVRANRQLAVALQVQGLNEEGAHFAYRAQVLQRRVSWFQMLQDNLRFRQRMQTLGAWLFSWFLYLLAGYGYRLQRRAQKLSFHLSLPYLPTLCPPLSFHD